jgi:hypothetical protein
VCVWIEGGCRFRLCGCIDLRAIKGIPPLSFGGDESFSAQPRRGVIRVFGLFAIIGNLFAIIGKIWIVWTIGFVRARIRDNRQVVTLIRFRAIRTAGRRDRYIIRIFMLVACRHVLASVLLKRKFSAKSEALTAIAYTKCN